MKLLLLLPLITLLASCATPDPAQQPETYSIKIVPIPYAE